MSRFVDITLTPGDIDFIESIVIFLEELLDQAEEDDE